MFGDENVLVLVHPFNTSLGFAHVPGSSLSSHTSSQLGSQPWLQLVPVALHDAVKLKARAFAIQVSPSSPWP